MLNRLFSSKILSPPPESGLSVTHLVPPHPLPGNSVYNFLDSVFPVCVTLPSTRSNTLFSTSFFTHLPFLLILPSFCRFHSSPLALHLFFLPTELSTSRFIGTTDYSPHLCTNSLLTSHSSPLSTEYQLPTIFFKLPTSKFLLFFSTPLGAGGSSPHSSFLSTSYNSPASVLPIKGNKWGFPRGWLGVQRVDPLLRPYEGPLYPLWTPSEPWTKLGAKQNGFGRFRKNKKGRSAFRVPCSVFTSHFSPLTPYYLLFLPFRGRGFFSSFLTSI